MDALSTSYGGNGLSLHEQHAIRIALNKLKIDEKTAAVPAFWGKINGSERDYIIAVSVRSSFGQILKQYYVFKYDDHIFSFLF